MKELVVKVPHTFTEDEWDTVLREWGSLHDMLHTLMLLHDTEYGLPDSENEVVPFCGHDGVNHLSFIEDDGHCQWLGFTDRRNSARCDPFILKQTGNINITKFRVCGRFYGIVALTLTLRLGQVGLANETFIEIADIPVGQLTRARLESFIKTGI